MSTTTSSPTIIPTGTWIVDPAHSKVGFAVKHMGIATVAMGARHWGRYSVDELERFLGFLRLAREFYELEASRLGEQNRVGNQRTSDGPERSATPQPEYRPAWA